MRLTSFGAFVAGLVVTLSVTAAPAGFGPVIERSVADDGVVDAPFLIDLDTGKSFAPPKNFQGDARALFRWMAEHGIDAMGEGGDDGLIGLDMTARRIESAIADAFPDVPEAMTARFLDQLAEIGRPGTPVNLDAKAGVGPAATYLFRTREGADGVLQIAGWGPGRPVGPHPLPRSCGRCEHRTPRAARRGGAGRRRRPSQARAGGRARRAVPRRGRRAFAQVRFGVPQDRPVRSE